MKTKNIKTTDIVYIKNAHLHNLKNINVSIPQNKLTVITGVSGSGKSTLAFDTLYAEGQRRYVESLSSYARQFLGKLEKPQVDDIKGLAPAIAIQQKVISGNSRSTVGTSTEIYDYLRLLFSRVGKTYSPVSGEEVKKDEVTDVINYITQLPEGGKYILSSPLEWEDKKFPELLKLLKSQGYVRLEVGGRLITIDDLESFGFIPEKGIEINLVIERFSVEYEDEFLQRFADSVQTAFYEGKGICFIKNTETETTRTFSNAFERDGITFLEPTIHFFSFNNPYGACPMCEGYGKVLGIDEDLVITNKNLSLYEDTILCWRGEKMSEWKDEFIKQSAKYKFPIHKPYFELTESQKEILWKGNGDKNFPCLNNFFKMLEENTYKIQYRVMLSRYRGRTICPECKGKRLRPETEYVKINGYSLTDWVDIPLDQLYKIIQDLSLDSYQKKVSQRLLFEINNRLSFLLDVGLGYLTLNRASNTLSGGESQRINLATSLGSSLVGSIYILDEPSIGLHGRDTERLISVLKRLRNLGNTVVVVEHDEDIMKAADYLVDIGPNAGNLGGEVVFEGNFKDMLKTHTLTSDYLNGDKKIEVPVKRRKTKEFIEITGARQNNLKGIDVKLPLHCLTVITGVSGSGKSTLMKDILTPALQRKLGLSGDKPGSFSELKGNIKEIEHLELVDQNPIGKSSRSNPATYVKAFDDIRDLFAKQKLSILNGYKPKHFSFNVEGGRCETCQGEGHITVEMQFMADIELECETCHGKRFKQEILEVQYEGKNISDILEMTIEESIVFFKNNKQDKIVIKLQPLEDVGLGYLQLGQSSGTLSGGEAQRIKLASFLVKGNASEKTLFIFDEPSTGLHFDDINKLLKSFNALIEKGHSVMVIEHHPDIIKCADYVVDIGPEAGINGGQVVFSGTPEDLVKCKKSYTGLYLKDKL
ncbi:excinuclease ABC subunit UvrA [Apibacter adventoris]|uniref:excinuclease ABC subunit UvrA n=1 Tax=Apibacter adventoris TaxID=1679466 RepID=UPI000CF644E1|nr:excinuclease ABC subunit UvrA [Apibacter adventoris]PQL94822.1 excinuclease ABC subunit A [Apibacter adventoris]